ncbi:MAG TPA: nucleotidyltransferase domain-containing protein [Candidatus Dormibacteraeota bacterium]|nr:nucleotidyltransferase domain-containing protein [Candidatus Dormibacteraeota bacterium]
MSSVNSPVLHNQIAQIRSSLSFAGSAETNAPPLDSLRWKGPEIARAARRHRASNVRVFGSVARGDAGPGSDYDFVVDLDAALGGLAASDHLDRLEQELRGLVGRPVHVVTARHDSAFARRVRLDAQPI